jgi:hypothetical protein
MVDETIEEQETSPKPDEEGEPSKSPEEAGTSTEVEDQIAQLKKTNQGLYERLKKEEAERKKIEEELVKLKPSEEGKSSQPEVPSDIEDRVELRLQGYSNEEIAFIKRNAEGKSLLEAIKDPFVEEGIKGLRAKKKAEQATPPPSSKSPETGEKVKKEEKIPFMEWKMRRAKSSE